MFNEVEEKAAVRLKEMMDASLDLAKEMLDSTKEGVQLTPKQEAFLKAFTGFSITMFLASLSANKSKQNEAIPNKEETSC